MPTAFGARFHDVRVQLFGTSVERSHLGGGGDAAPVGGEPVPEHVGDETELRVLTDRADGGGHRADIAGSADQLRVSVTDVLQRYPTAAYLVDEHAPGETVVDDPTRAVGTTDRTDGEAHRLEG